MLFIIGFLVIIDVFVMFAICSVSGRSNRQENDLDQIEYLKKVQEEKNGNK